MKQLKELNNKIYWMQILEKPLLLLFLKGRVERNLIYLNHFHFLLDVKYKLIYFFLESKLTTWIRTKLSHSGQLVRREQTDTM